VVNCLCCGFEGELGLIKTWKSDSIMLRCFNALNVVVCLIITMTLVPRTGKVSEFVIRVSPRVRNQQNDERE
jgi:hypothetical protein